MRVEKFSEQIFLRNYKGFVRFVFDNFDFDEEKNLINYYNEVLKLE